MSDKIEPATDADVMRAKTLLSDHNYATQHRSLKLSLIARIEAQQAENAALRGLLEEYAKHAADSGWINLAEEIRRRASKGEL